jgi:glutathione S-transferase
MGLFDFLKPHPPERSPQEQARVSRELSGLALYHFTTCPYCVRVRRALARLGLDELELRDIRRDPEARRELIEGGGKGQVPCLRIEEDGGSVRWLYESADIVRWLEARFAPAGAR